MKSVCALGLTPDCALSIIKKADIIIVPASGWDAIDLIAKNTPLLPWLKKWHDRGAYIAGVCTGVAFLAECGMLDGKRATTHWGLADILGERYPKVRWQPEQFVTEDGRLFCSGGVYTAIDLSLYLVEKFCGHEIALQCAKSLLLSMPRGPAVWIFSRTIVASAFRREDQTKRGIPADSWLLDSAIPGANPQVGATGAVPSSRTLPAFPLTIIPADHGQPRRRRDRHERRRAIPRAAPVLLAVAHPGRRAADGHLGDIPFLVGHRCAPLSLVKH
ncbi:MAG: DJ-1/PfpI family protein [Pseudolabrys sp.]